MYQAKSGVKNFFPLLGDGGWGVGALDKKYFSGLNMYQAKSGVKNFSLYWGGGGGGVPWQKFFLPVWTCIKPNLVSKMFSFTRGESLDKKSFCQSEHVSSQIWCQNFFPLQGGGGVPSTKIFFPVWTCIKPNQVSKIFPLTETGYPPPPHGTWDWVPPGTWTWDPPPPQSEQTDISKYKYYLHSYYVRGW